MAAYLFYFSVVWLISWGQVHPCLHLSCRRHCLLFKCPFLCANLCAVLKLSRNSITFFFAGFYRTCSSRINSESFQAQIGFMIVLSLHWLYLQHINGSEFQLYFDAVHEGRQGIPKNQVKFAMAWALMCIFQYFFEALLIAVGQDPCYWRACLIWTTQSLNGGFVQLSSHHTVAFLSCRIWILRCLAFLPFCFLPVWLHAFLALTA